MKGILNSGRKHLLAFFLASGCAGTLQAQQVTGSYGPRDTLLVPAVHYNGEWIPARTLEWVWVVAPMPAHVKKKMAKWTRLRNAVYVTYPYARRAGYIINDINRQLAGIKNKAERKEFLRTREAQLKKEFSDPLTNLSVYQGRVLMKLINRQTGNNCYELVKEYRGGVTARFYQTVAFFFNSSMKQPYNAASGGEDAEIESIVMEIERMYR